MNNKRKLSGLLKRNRFWRWSVLVLAGVLAVYLIAGKLQDKTGFSATSKMPLDGLIAITIAGCLLLVIITALLIEDHHRYGRGGIFSKLPETSYVLVAEQEGKAVIKTDAIGVITYMNETARLLTGQMNRTGSGRLLEEIYQLKHQAGDSSKRIWKAIPGEAGMMTGTEIVTLLIPQEELRICQQVYHYFDNKGEMKEKAIVFSPDVSSSNRSSPVKGTMEAPGANVSTSVRHYAQIGGNSGDLCWEWDIRECMMRCFSENAGMLSHLPGRQEDARPWWRANIHPDDLRQVQQVYAKAIETCATSVQQEFRFRCSDGVFRHVLDRAAVVCNTKGEAVLLLGVMQDITPIKLEEKRLAEAVLMAQETERKTIGEELHDNINQILATSMLQLSLIDEQACDPDRVRELVRLTKGHTMKAVNEIRKLSHELSPVRLDHTDLEECIRDLLSSYNTDEQFEIDFNFDPQVRELLTDEMKLHLFRILQEQLKNIRQHAGASCILISLTNQGDGIELVVTDDGRGFDALKPSKGIGLANIRRRVHAMGGSVMVDSKPGAGVQLRVKISVEL